jgi:adenylate cyclase
MVNLGARMESGARNYHVGTMLTESTKLAAERGGNRCVFRFLDRIVVKGRVAPVAIFELVGLREEVGDSVLECVHHFEAGLDRYFQRDFEQAESLFRRSALLEPRKKEEEQGGGASASTVFVERCAILRGTPPPPSWDGVWMMQRK